MTIEEYMKIEESKQIKCYCGHTSYCDCSPLEEPKQFTPEMLVDLKQGLDNAIQKSNPLFPNYNFLNKKEEPKQEENEIIDISDHDGIGNAVDNLNNEPKQETLDFMSKELDIERKRVHKQETLEEVAEKYARKQCDDMYDNQGLTGASWGWETSLDFIAGAKWQAERMYSEEDMKQAYLDGCKIKLTNIYHLEKWFTQFKKK